MKRIFERLIYEKIKEYIRKDNIWERFPIIGSLFGIFVSSIVGVLCEHAQSVFWFLFFIIAILCAVFVYFSYSYVDKWHSIIRVMQNIDAPLYKSCILLAALDQSRKEHRVNNCIRVKSVSVDYYFKRTPYTDNGNFTFPFQVQYKIKGFVEQGFSTLYHHVVAHKSKYTSSIISSAFENPTLASEISLYKSNGNLQVFKIVCSHKLKRGESVTYRIMVPFDNETGLSEKPGQRLLFYPENISSLFSSGAQITFNLHFPKDLYDKYVAKRFNSINIQKNPYLHEETPDSELILKKYTDNDSVIFRNAFSLEDETCNNLYCINLKLN